MTATLTLPRRRTAGNTVTARPATESFLRDMAFVLKMTERIRDDIHVRSDVSQRRLPLLGASGV